LAASHVSVDEVTLTWPEAFDEGGIGSYRLLHSGQPERSVAAGESTITLRGLEEGASVEAEIVAVDGAGNRSMPISISVRTLAASAPTPAPALEGIRAALSQHQEDGGTPLSLDLDQPLDGPTPVWSKDAFPTAGLDEGTEQSLGTTGVLSRASTDQGAAVDDVGADAPTAASDPPPPPTGPAPRSP
jgi:hypothetical protein